MNWRALAAGAWADIVAAWRILPPAIRRRLEVGVWTASGAGGAVLWEAITHHHFTAHTLTLAAWAAGWILLATLRQLPRDVWTDEQRKNGG